MHANKTFDRIQEHQKHDHNYKPKLEWWQKDVIYQIYVKSFMDSNGDGIGDLKGVTQKLDYVKQLGINSIWLSPINPSNHKDNGYDVTSFVEIDPVFGSFIDFDELVEQVHKRGLLYLTKSKFSTILYVFLRFVLI
jgi:1,4-alpha-glucan branching enzyme